MNQRLNIRKRGARALRTLYGIESYLDGSPLDRSLRELIYVRVSQINKCAYCLDMHYKDARANDESEQRLYGLSAWRNSPYYTARERAALAWAEAITQSEIPDSVYQKAAEHLSDVELVDLTLAVTTINTWNRINIAFPEEPGGYQAGQFRLAKIEPGEKRLA